MLPFSNMLQYKNIYVLYCIVTLAALIIFFFLKIISLIHSVNTSFIGKEKVYIFHIYFLITTLYICICFLFFNNAKRPRGVPFQILLRVMLLELSLPGIRIIAFVVGLDSDDEILR